LVKISQKASESNETSKPISHVLTVCSMPAVCSSRLSPLHVHQDLFLANPFPEAINNCSTDTRMNFSIANKTTTNIIKFIVNFDYGI